MALHSTQRAPNVSTDGQELFFTEAGVDAVQVLDIASYRVVDQIPVGASPHLPSFTPDGNLRLVVAQGAGELDLVDPDALRKIAVQPAVSQTAASTMDQERATRSHYFGRDSGQVRWESRFACQ